MQLETVPPSQWASRLEPAWNELLRLSPGGSVFLTPEWIGAWWRAYGDRLEPRLTVSWAGAGQLRALAPLYRRSLKIAGLAGPRVVALMGDEEVGSEYSGLLARPGEEADLISSLGRSLQGEWSLLDLSGLREDSPFLPGLKECLAAGAPPRIHCERHPCSAVPLPDDYEKYLASLAQKFRANVRYRTNKLMKNFTVRLVVTSREEEVERHLERFFEMHEGRWRAEGLPSSFAHPRMRAFYGDVSRLFLRRGWLRFYHLEVDGVIRASQFGFAYGGTLHSLQESFDVSFRPRGVGGVGVVLRGMSIRESIREGLRVYDFLGGIEESKIRWGTGTHHVQRVRIGAPGWSGAAAFLATAGWRMAKDWAREHSPRFALEGRERWRQRFRAWRARPPVPRGPEEPR